MEEGWKKTEENVVCPVTTEDDFVKETGKNVMTPYHKVDLSEHAYKTPLQWKTDFGGFPEEFYEALSLRSMGVTPKEYKNYVKKIANKGKGKKRRNILPPQKNQHFI